MKLTLALLALVTSVIAGPVPQSSYDDYGTTPPAHFHYALLHANTLPGSYDNVPAAPVDNPPPPAGGYGSYGMYSPLVTSL